MSETQLAMNAPMSSTGQPRRWLQVVAVVLLLEVGGILGALTGFVPAGPICSVLLPLLAATWFLRQEGQRWRALVFGRRLSVLQAFSYAALALLVVFVSVSALGLLVKTLGLPPADYSLLQRLLEGNLAMYLWFLLPVSWGSAAIGEELLARGFLQYRIERATNTATAVVLQAAIFGAAHFYQGATGILYTFALGLVFGAVYVKCGRNLLPLVIAHGVMDTFAVTALYLGRADLLAWG